MQAIAFFLSDYKGFSINYADIYCQMELAVKELEGKVLGIAIKDPTRKQQFKLNDTSTHPEI